MPGPVFLVEREAETIHRMALQVLERTGILLDHEEAETLLLEAGAHRDSFGRVLMPPAMVNEALDRASTKIQMWDQEGNRAMLLRNGRTFFGPGSDAMYNVDRHTNLIRMTRLDDVRENVRIADALPGFSFVMSMGLPQDVPVRKLYPAIFAEMVANTTKPLIVTAPTLDEVARIHAIACIVAGGEQALRRKPFYLSYVDPISPLHFDRSGMERLLFCAEHELPIVFAAGANCGGGAPITPEGGVVQGSAESLAGLVLALLKNDNARFVYGANTSVLDMTSSIVSYGAPEWFRTVAMYADVGRYYDLPSWGTAGCSDSYVIDAQAAMEAYEGILMATRSGTTLAHDVGYLAHGALYDARMLVLADVMIERARQLLGPPDLSPESLRSGAADARARQAAPQRDPSGLSELCGELDRLPQRHEKDLVGLLTERMNDIAGTHAPRRLDAGVSRQIDRYLDSL